MANTLGSLPTKVLLLFVLSLALCFYDIPVWASELGHLDVQVTFTLAFSLVALGVYLKRRALLISFETSRIGFARGIALLVASMLVYAYGSYTIGAAWLHYVSLLLFVTGYIALRMGTSPIRVLAPLYPILLFAFIPSSSFDALNPSLLVPLLALFYGLAFLIYVGPRPRQFALPMLLVDVALAVWLLSARGVLPSYAAFAVPASLLLLLAVPGVRRFSALAGSPGGHPCFSHTPEPNGFCSFCGKKVARAATPENFGGWGLISALAVVTVLAVSSVPLLTMANGVNDAVYTARGPTLAPLPITPAGWQVNGTALNSWTESNSTYKTVRVYVPLAQPEAKNYTVYYSVTPNSNARLPPTGGIPGWRLVSNPVTPEAGVQGRLGTYVKGNTTMVTYAGSRTMTFLNGSGFATEYVSVGFVRVFKDSNYVPDTAQFLADLKAFWVPALDADSFNSSWASFIGTTLSDFNALEPLLAVGVSVSLMGWAAYRVIRSDERLDRFYTAAALTGERSWRVLIELLNGPKMRRRGYELAGSTKALSQGEVNSALESLVKEGLVRHELVSSGDDVRLFWKARG